MPKAERLRGRRTFQLLRRLGTHRASEPLHLYALYFKVRTDITPLRVAFMVPKRFVRKAARRNRIRRLLREAYRLQKPEFLQALPTGSAWLLWQWRSASIPTLTELQRKVRALFLQFCSQCATSS